MRYVRWSGDDEAAAMEGLASGTPLRKRGRSGPGSPVPGSVGRAAGGAPSSAAGIAAGAMSPAGAGVGGVVTSVAGTPGPGSAARRRGEGATGGRRQKALQELESGYGDGVDLLHSLANSSEHLDTLEETYKRQLRELEQAAASSSGGAPPSAKRQRTKRGSKPTATAGDSMSPGEVQRVHEECAAIISDMRSLSAANTPGWAANAGKAGTTGGQLPGSNALDAAGSSLAAAAFGTPSASGNGLNDICLALWSAAPLQGAQHGYGVGGSFSMGSPAFQASASAPHPSLFVQGKQRKPAAVKAIAAKAQYLDAGKGAAEGAELAGTVLNMDVVDYAAIVKSHQLQQQQSAAKALEESASPRSEDSLSISLRVGSAESVVVSESENDQGEFPSVCCTMLPYSDRLVACTYSLRQQ